MEKSPVNSILEALVTRINALERENASLTADNEHLTLEFAAAKKPSRDSPVPPPSDIVAPPPAEEIVVILCLCLHPVK